MKKRRFRVGIFDSGIGGLTVLKECVRIVPEAKYFYFGDNQRAPYGNRSEEEIFSFAREALDKFRRMKADAVVIACNTVTAVCLDTFRREYPFPLIGIEPAVKPAAGRGGEALVLATLRTAKSARLKILTERFSGCSFRIAPCPYLAEAIEEYFSEGERFLLSAHLPEGKFDSVVLGCTHYAFFAEEISAFYRAPVFDGATGVAKRLDQVLEMLRLGIGDHYVTTIKTNKSLRKNRMNDRIKGVKFIGKCKNLNRKVYLQTYVLEKSKK